jgi:hypothetical protein
MAYITMNYEVYELFSAISYAIGNTTVKQETLLQMLMKRK